MTTTPNEPETNPDVIPSGDPDLNPINPGEVPDPPMPGTEPAPAR
jgi:hypothetical protein